MQNSYIIEDKKDDLQFYLYHSKKRLSRHLQANVTSYYDS